MTDRPSLFPDWCMKNNSNGPNDTPTKSAYPQSKTDDGFDIGEIPPREWENYWKNLTALWTHYFDEQIEKISTVGVPIGVALPTFPSLGGYNCTALTAADEYGFVLCNGQTINDSSSVFNGKVIPNLNGNNFLKGSNKDNQIEGNKDHKVNFDHTHNYRHTHEISKFQINTTATGKVLQLYNLTPDASDESKWDEIISYNGVSGTGDGNVLQLVYTGSMPLTTFYSGGVSGSAVNGFYDKAETSTVTGGAVLNIEPQNITTIYIIRIK